MHIQSWPVVQRVVRLPRVLRGLGAVTLGLSCGSGLGLVTPRGAWAEETLPGMPLVLERDVVAEGSVTVNRTGSDLSPGANVPTESVPGPLLALVGWADPGVSRSALAPIDRSTTPQTWIPGVTLPIANPGTTARVVDPADGDEGLSWVAASQGLDLPAPQLEPIDVGTVGVQGRRPIAQPDQTDPLGQVSPVVQVSQVAPTLPDSREVNPPDPNTDRFPQPLPDLTPDRDDRPVLDETPEPSQNLPATGSGITVDITRLEVVGSTTYSAETLAEITAPFENRALTLEELQSIADQITQLYLNEGYTTSRAVLVDQEIIDGVVQIQVIEGILAEVIIEGTERLSRDYIEDRIRLGAKVPLRTDQLEDQLRMLRVDPLIGNIETSLRASEKVGQSVLGVRIVEAPNIVGSIGSDNYSPESVGGQRTRAAVTYNNIMGNGESITGTWDRSYIGGSDVFRLTYKMPVNARNGTVQFQSTTDRNEITQKPFDAFDIAGKTDRYDFTYRQPIIRNPRQELALSIGYAYQTSRTFVLNTPTRIGTTTGAETDGVTRTSIIKFSQDFVRRDASGAWAFQSQFSFGTDWFGATTQDDDIPDSQFFSWLSQGQRVQRLNNDHLLIIQGNLQFASGPMLGSQQFVIGGGQSVRGYRQNTRAADSGWRFSIEDRWTVRRNETGRSLLQLAPFFDAGLVWNHRKNPNALSTDSRFLAGAGLGLLWQPTPKINVRVDYGIPLVGVEDNGNDALQSRGLYFTVGYNFAR